MRRSLTAVAAVTASLALAGAGAADTSVTAPYANGAFNDCNYELVTVQGMFHMVESTMIDANGEHFHVTVNLSDVKGVALVSGARYVQVSTQTQTSNLDFNGASEQTSELTEVLNRLGEDGTLDDELLRVSFHMTVNANGVPTIDRTDSRIDCH